MSDSSDLLDVMVIVDEPYADRLDEVAAALRAAGMRVDQVLRGIGMVSGAVSAEAYPSIKSVPGVLDVEVSKPYGLD